MDSTTTEGRGEGVSNTQPVGETIAQFLSRPKPRPAGQEYEYLTPPTINPAHPQPPPPPPPRVRYPPSLPLRHSLGRQEQGGPNHCNPGGYFRVKRLSTPSTDYTLGSDHSKPEQRCRTNPAHPLAVNETTKAYIDDFAGPDTFRIVLDGPEHYVTNQQVSLGDCTYAIPYVLSRPGQFWLTQIEHGYEDFEALNENYDGQFAPKFLGINILLPEVNATAPRDDAGYDAYKEYKQAVSEVYQFTVCGGCPQLLNPGSQPKYEDWPECSLEPIKGTREYGVFARRQSVLAFEDLAKQGFEWVGARPSCRHGPRLSTFQTLESVESLIGADTVSARLYGSPPPLVPSTIEAFQVSRQETENCLQHERKIYFTGDSHVRQLLTGLMNRFHGDTGDLADFQGWSTHIEQLGGVHIQQDFDQWGQDLQGKLRYMRDPSYVPFMTQPRHPLAILEEFDTILIEFGAWHAAGFKVGTMFKTVEFLEFTKEILWNLAHVRQERQAYFKRTGFGYDDLKIFWMGGIPWPDTREESDMRTNTRLQYWDDLVNAEIGAINEHYRDQGGMIDTLDAFSKFLPHRKLSPDTSHHRAKEPVDAIVQVLAHKLDLCKAHLTPVLPPPLVSLFPPAAEVISSIPASHGQASSNDLQ
ncbi:hypothetical protein BGZ83_002361 [Gryganskiella cystojenkinii]|nr:hypothetical protein BGZ83_002361 [Gryganskiella cystojenkinii]